ncbi:MAG: reprolysin-like metallopeptidase [Pyrinomonadaceae bacterium]
MSQIRRTIGSVAARNAASALLLGSVFTIATVGFGGSESITDYALAEPITPFMTTHRNTEKAELFELVGVLKTQSSTSVAAVREQEIDIKFDDINFDAAAKLSFPLLDGISYEAVRSEREGFERFDSDEFTWRGKIFAENDFSGDVVFSVKGKALSGLIYSPTAVYEIVPQADFKHVLVQLDQTRFPACGGAIPVDDLPEENDNSSLGNADRFPSADDGSQIDVLVTYTALLRQALGGTPQAQSFAQQAIASTNTAYLNSDITMRLRLVGTLEVSYNEAAGTLSAALPWSRNDPETAATRNIVQADMVSIIIQNASDACGIGYLMTTVGPQFAGSAFSAASRSCAVGNLTFAHELGHNQAAHHNPENAGSAAYPYAYGHYVNGSFRTVMSYVNQCPSGCSRVPYFSNPSISFNGFPTGIADQRDNHRTLNNTALTVSQFRDGLAVTLTPTNTPTPTSTAQNTPTFTPTRTSTNTPTSTPTSSGTPSINGRVTYGNADTPPKYISNVTVTGTGSPNVFATTAAPGGTAGQYSLMGFGSGSYTVTLSKTTGQNSITSNDAARISQHVAGTSLLTTDSQRATADVSGNGSISSQDAAFIARFAVGAGAPTGNTNQWNFYLPPGPTFPVASSPTSRTYSSVTGNLNGEDYVGLLLGEVTGNWTPGAARPANTEDAEKSVIVALPNIVKAQNEIIIPVNVLGVANRGVISYEFELRYDPNVIMPVAEPVDVAGTASRGLTVVTNAIEPGLLRVVMYGPMPIDENGVLLNLRFARVGKAVSNTAISFERFMFNEGEPQANITNGRIKLFVGSSLSFL